LPIEITSLTSLEFTQKTNLAANDFMTLNQFRLQSFPEHVDHFLQQNHVRRLSADMA
jgi:hypothetical protein